MERASVQWVWNWSGECAGYWDGDHLWSLAGRHVGTMQGREIYDRHGVYLGEVKGEARLLFFGSKKHWYGTRFNPQAPRDPCQPPANLPAQPMPPGCRNFTETEPL